MALSDNKKKVRSEFCNKEYWDSVNRLKQHLAHIKGEMKWCPQEPKEVMNVMNQYMRDAKNLKKVLKKRGRLNYMKKSWGPFGRQWVMRGIMLGMRWRENF